MTRGDSNNKNIDNIRDKKYFDSYDNNDIVDTELRYKYFSY